MLKKIIGIALSIGIVAIIYLSFFVGRLMSMKDANAVDNIITNEKKGSEISKLIYVVILAPMILFVILHFVFNIG